MRYREMKKRAEEETKKSINKLTLFSLNSVLKIS